MLFPQPTINNDIIKFIISDIHSKTEFSTNLLHKDD